MNVKVLLINPSINFNKFGQFRRYMRPMPPIGLAYIASVLKTNNIDLKIIDDFVDNKGIEGILDIAKSYVPDIVGLSCLTPSAPLVFRIANALKNYDRRIKIVLGNIHASFFAEHILKYEDVDIIVHGEGESTFLEIVEAFSKKNVNLDCIKGISYKLNGNIIKTQERLPLEDLDSLPYPAWEYLPVKAYGLLPFMDIKKPSLSILSSRGCIYRCSYCSLGYTHVNYRKRNFKKVVDEIEYLVSNFGVKQIGFVDPIFPLRREDCIDVCNEMLKRRLNKEIVWICETRADHVDRQLLDLMRDAGCRRILYGIESSNRDTLDSVNKQIFIEKIKRNIRHTKESKIETAGLFMIGFPSETEVMVKQTINFAKELDLDFAKFAITTPFPGSRLFDDWLDKNTLDSCDWENFVTFNPDPDKLVSICRGIKPSRLIELQVKAHREFYLRPRIIFRHLFKIKTIRLLDLIQSIATLFLHGKTKIIRKA